MSLGLSLTLGLGLEESRGEAREARKSGADDGGDPCLELLSLGFDLTFGLVEEGDERCTRGDTREPSRERWDQGNDPSLEILRLKLVLGLEILTPNLTLGLVEECTRDETREARKPGAEEGGDPSLDILDC